MIKAITHIIFIIAAIFSFTGCGETSRQVFKERLAAADSLAEVAPEQAVLVLDKLKSDLPRQSVFMRNRYQLVNMSCLLAMADKAVETKTLKGYDYGYGYDTTKSVTRVALPFPVDSCLSVCRYFSFHGNVNHHLAACRLASDVLLRCRRPSEALVWADEACSLADNHDDLPDSTKSDFHFRKAQILSLSTSTFVLAYREYGLARKYALRSNNKSFTAFMTLHYRKARQRLVAIGHSDVATAALKLDADSGSDNPFSFFFSAVLIVLFFVLLCAVVVLVRYIKRNKDEEYATNFRHRIYVEEIQSEITSLRKVITHLQFMLKDEKFANTDNLKTITEQQWRLGRLAERVSEVDKKEANRRVAEQQKLVIAAPVVAKLHDMASHPARNVFPSEGDWNALASLIEKHSPDFYSVMNHSTQLRSEEYRVCLLIKAEFKMSEICYLLGMSNAKLTNLRARLYTKVFGKEGGAKDFDRAIHEGEYEKY